MKDKFYIKNFRCIKPSISIHLLQITYPNELGTPSEDQIHYSVVDDL